MKDREVACKSAETLVPAVAGGTPRGLYVTNPGRRSELFHEAEALPTLLLSSAAAANAVMLGAGYFHPLQGYMDATDALETAMHMQTRSGLFWPVPCLNLCSEPPAVKPRERLALRDPNLPSHPVLAIQQVTAVEYLSETQIIDITHEVYGTVDRTHPGVDSFLSQGAYVISGPIEVLNYSYFNTEFPGTFRTAEQLRATFMERGWSRVVAFQTRNPMHRAHEELCKMAMRETEADGLLIHMLLGRLKPGDVPATVRDSAIRKMVELYFPGNNVLIAGYGFDMLYAGPREALLHAVFRQNAGCSHLIVGRDHAGVGDFYEPFAAQAIFDRIPRGALAIDIVRADHTAWSRRLGKVVMLRDVPDHGPEDFINLSGTRVRQMLMDGQDLPPEFARPEVAEILMQYYRSQR